MAQAPEPTKRSDRGHRIWVARSLLDDTQTRLVVHRDGLVQRKSHRKWNPHGALNVLRVVLRLLPAHDSRRPPRDDRATRVLLDADARKDRELVRAAALERHPSGTAKSGVFLARLAQVPIVQRLTVTTVERARPRSREVDLERSSGQPASVVVGSSGCTSSFWNMRHRLTATSRCDLFSVASAIVQTGACAQRAQMCVSP